MCRSEGKVNAAGQERVWDGCVRVRMVRTGPRSAVWRNHLPFAGKRESDIL